MIFRRTIRTADEELDGIWNTAMLSIIWYTGLIRSMLTQGFQFSLLLFLIAGLLPVMVAVRQIQRASYYRKLHRQCVSFGKKEQGRIVNCIREYQWNDNTDTQRNRHRVARYYLIVEVQNWETGVSMRIQSQGYSFPVYRYLKDPWVEVYTDQSGWKKTLDGFHLKRSLHEPDIPLENSNIYLKDFRLPPSFFKIITTVILIFVFLQLIFT